MTLHSEIFEQPGILGDLLQEQRQTAERVADAIRQAQPTFLLLAARGTSDNAARYATYLWGAQNHLPVALATPSLFTYYQRPPRLQGALVIGISQSGQSPDIVAVVREGHRQGCPTIAITNAPHSPLADAADIVFDLQAGQEEAIAATKTYTAELMAMAMISAALQQDQEQPWQQLARVPAWVQEMLQLDAQIATLVERYRYMRHCVVVGRGFNYATAFEWALKLKELTYVVAEPYSSADLLHGPIAMIEDGFPVLAIAPDGAVFDSMHSLLTQLHREQRAELVVISNREETLQLAQSPVPLPRNIPEWLTPLVSIVAGQLFAYHLTQTKKYDTETPRSLRKVTKTQ